MAKEISTLEDLGELLQTHVAESEKRHQEVRGALGGVVRENAEHFRSIGDHLVRIEARLEEIPTRGELGEMMARLYDAAAMEAKLETIRKNIREKLHVEV
jgi:hypothetical protein